VKSIPTFFELSLTSTATKETAMPSSSSVAGAGVTLSSASGVTPASARTSATVPAMRMFCGVPATVIVMSLAVAISIVRPSRVMPVEREVDSFESVAPRSSICSAWPTVRAVVQTTRRSPSTVTSSGRP